MDMSKPTYCFLDLETTGVNPRLAKVISGAFVVTDKDHSILGQTHQKCHIDQARFTKNNLGWNIDNWPSEAEKIHGISYEDSLSFQHPLDWCRSIFKFISSFNTRLTLVYHANAAFDIRFLFSHFALHSDKAYYLLQNYVLREQTENTMAMARAYRKQGSGWLSEAQKHEKQVLKYDKLLTKDRKTRATDAKIHEWTSKRDEAQSNINNIQTQSITFDSVGLAHLCERLDIPLSHHNALSDTLALIPIHKFLKENLYIQ